MSLPYDVCRCLGEKPAGTCQQRQRCLRYINRDDYGPRTPFASWLCGPFDNDHLLRNEKTKPLPPQADHS